MSGLRDKRLENAPCQGDVTYVTNDERTIQLSVVNE